MRDLCIVEIQFVVENLKIIEAPEQSYCITQKVILVRWISVKWFQWQCTHITKVFVLLQVAPKLLSTDKARWTWDSLLVNSQWEHWSCSVNLIWMTDHEHTWSIGITDQPTDIHEYPCAYRTVRPVYTCTWDTTSWPSYKKVFFFYSAISIEHFSLGHSRLVILQRLPSCYTGWLYGCYTQVSL